MIQDKLTDLWGDRLLQNDLINTFREIKADRVRDAQRAQLEAYLPQNVFKVVSQKSIPTQIRQLVLYIGNSKG